MNILFTTLNRLSENTTAGGELYLLDLMKGLTKSGVLPYLVSPDSENSNSLYVRRYDADGSYRAYEFHENNREVNFSKIIERFEIDIVHFQHFQTLPLSFMKTTKDMNKKLVITIHDYFLWCENFFLLSPLKGNAPSFCFFEENETFCAECLKKSGGLWELIYRRQWSGDRFNEEYIRQRRRQASEILGAADLIIAPTEYVRYSFLGVYPNINPERFIALEHGNFPVVDTVPKRFRAHSEKLKVAFLGGFKYEKGNTYFIELLRTLKDTKIEFYIIGSLDCPINKGDFKNLKITGQYRREELSGILNREGIEMIILLSPWAETFSYTLSEAIINGIPVIATDIGAFRERVSRHGVGFLVPYENPVPMTARLLKNIAERPEISGFFRKNCIDAAGSLKDVDAMVSEYMGLYKKISSGDTR